VRQHGIAGACYSTFAPQPKEISVNRQSASCMLIKNDTGCYFRGGLIEDTDLHLQILSKGMCSMRFNWLMIEKMKTGALKGGCQAIDYANSGRAKQCLKLNEQ